MDQKLEPLFTPWKIGNCEIKNRIVLTSMGGTDLFGWMEKNHFDKDGAHFIMEIAKNNVGLILPGCQPVYNPMFGQWLHKNKKMYADLKKWMPEFHKTGAKLFVQLTAGFGRSFTISSMMEMLYSNPVLKAVSKPFMNLDKITASASASPNRWSDKVPSREMTKEEIQEFIDSFAKSSKMLKDAGVDGVEVHAVHEGYLLDQFTLKYVNKRTDEYGGSLENRYRFAAEIVKAIKKECGKDFPVSLRYSVISKTKGFRQGALGVNGVAMDRTGAPAAAMPGTIRAVPRIVPSIAPAIAVVSGTVPGIIEPGVVEPRIVPAETVAVPGIVEPGIIQAAETPAAPVERAEAQAAPRPAGIRVAPGIAPRVIQDHHERVAAPLLLFAGDIGCSHGFEIFFGIKMDDFRLLPRLGIDAILELLL